MSARIQKNRPTMQITRHSQVGAALLTGLIFLVVLTLLTLSAIKATSLEERMAGNARDQDVAFQAAEAAIRDGMTQLPPLATKKASFVAGCAAGLCLTNTTTPVWTTITSNNDWNTSKTLAYTGTLTIDGTNALVNQPRYIIELLPDSLPPSGFSMSKGKGINSGATVTPFRLTARGWGLTTQAQATVQSAINY